MQARKNILLFKLQTARGVDSNPAATDAILTKGITISPYEGDTVTRDVDRPDYGNSADIKVGTFVKLSYSIELAGSGSAGSVPSWGSIMRSGGHTETIDAGTDVKYELADGSFEFGTGKFELDGQIHTLLDSHSKIGDITINSKGLPEVAVETYGLYAKPVPGSLTADLSGFQIPLPVTKDNTTLSIHGYNAVTSEFSLNPGANVGYRNLIGQESIFMNDFDPRGNLTFLAPDIGAKDFYAAVESHNGVTVDALDIVHGTVAGNIIQIEAPAVQLTGITHGDIDGDVSFQTPLNFTSDVGTSPYVITVR